MHAKFINDVNAAALLDQLIGIAFAQPRTPRSEQYRGGVRAALAFHVMGQPMQCEFESGTTDFDAFYSGVEEGRLIWAQHMARQLRGRRPADPIEIVAHELLHAHQIIRVMLNAMDDEQKHAVTQVLDAADMIECGTVRNHERSQAIVAAGYVLPESIPMDAVLQLKRQRAARLS